jgi:hypothetical protein
MIDPNKERAALIIRELKRDPEYLVNNLFFQNALQTFQVLNKIQAIDHRLITGGVLANITKLLLSLELQPGGPYAEDKLNPDPKLNTEIAIFLEKQGIRLPALEIFSRKVSARKENHKIFEYLHSLAQNRLRSLPRSFRSIISPKLEKIIQGDQDKQILLLAYYFKLSLGNHGAKITTDIIYELGLANLFLWLSYTIYDHLIDGEESLDSLPIANWASREFTLIISQQKSSQEYQSLFRKIMAQMDYSQVWERKYARFNQNKNNNISAQVKNYQGPIALSNKSLAHCLGPMLILDQLKLPPNSSQGKNILSFFKYYLSVRQLQDDIYDFEPDYQNGIITSANIKAIKNRIKPDDLTNYFINKELPRLNALTIKYQEMAETHLKAATIIKYPDYLNQFLSPLKTNPQEIKEFLSTYKKEAQMDLS